MMEKGSSLLGRYLVSMLDKALNKVLEPQLDDGDKLAEKLFICIQTGLAAGLDNEQIVERIREISYREHIQYSPSNSSRKGDAVSQ
jgi:hypothetical protein